MRNLGLNCFLCTAALLLLMTQQIMLTEAKPFLLLPANFFVLTTRAPCHSCSDTSSSSSSSSSVSTSSNFQIPDFITPKIRFLSTLLQGLSSGGNGGVKGGYSFTFNKFGGLGPSTTTTTSHPHTTEPLSVFEPDSSESTNSNTFSTTTEASKGSDSGLVSTSISGSIKTPENDVSSSFVISNRIGADDNDKENNNKTGNNDTENLGSTNEPSKNKSGSIDSTGSSLGGLGYKYESSGDKSAGSSTPGSGTRNQGYNYESSSEKSRGSTVSAGSTEGLGYKYESSGDKSETTTNQDSGYQYNKPSENEVAR